MSKVNLGRARCTGGARRRLLIISYFLSTRPITNNLLLVDLLLAALETIELASKFLDYSSMETMAEAVIAAAINQLHGELLCLCDRPLEGLNFLESAVDVAGEVLGPTSLNSQKALQSLHFKYGLTSACLPNSQGFEILTSASLSYDRLARLYFQTGAVGKAFHAVYRGLNISEMLGESELMAKAYSTVAFVTKSVDYANKAQEAAIPNSPTSAFTQMLYGGMRIGEGDFETARLALEKSIATAQKVRDYATLGLSMSVLGWNYFVQGKFDEALTVSDEMFQLGKEKGDDRFLNWGQHSRVRDFIALGRLDDARGIMDEIEEGFIKSMGGTKKLLNSDQVHLTGFRVRLAMNSGEVEGVKKVLDEHKEVVEKLKKPCTQLVEFAGLCGIIEGLLMINSEAVTEVLDAMASYVKSYPIFGARYNYYRFRLLKEQDALKEAWRSAVEYGMDIEKNMIREEGYSEEGDGDVAGISEEKKLREGTAEDKVGEEALREEFAKVLDGRVWDEVKKDVGEVCDDLIKLWEDNEELTADAQAAKDWMGGGKVEGERGQGLQRLIIVVRFILACITKG